MSCTDYRPDHNGECLNCDDWADEHPLGAAGGAVLPRIRHWTYQDQGGTHVFSDLDILKEYFPFWMRQAERVGYRPGIHLAELQELCIQDWVMVHWAWELEEAGER